MDTLTALANVGTGTDELAGVNTPDGFVGAAALTDETGTLISDANPLPVAGTVAVSGTVPVSGTVAVSGTVPVSGTVAVSGTVPVSIASAVEIANDQGNPVPVNGTVAVSGTVPVSAASLPLPAGAATQATLASLLAAAPALVTTVPDNLVPAPPARVVGQDIWNCSYSDVGASVLSPDMVLRSSGTGVTYSQAAGTLGIVAGVSTNAEWLARTVKSWRGSLQARVSTVLSQRIVNNNFAVLLADAVGEGLSCTINSATSISVTKTAHGFTALNIGQSMFVGGIVGAAGVPGRYAIASIPDANTINFTVAGWPASGSCTVDLFGYNHTKLLYNGATATSAIIDCQRRGWATGDGTITINTTATPGHIAQIHHDGRNVTFSDLLRATATSRNVTVRGDRVENLPDDNLDLYLYFWSFNGSTAPASSTTWSISFACVEKFANLPVYIQGQRAQGTAFPAPVTTVGTVTVDTELPAAAALAEGAANATTATVGAATLVFNGATWDRNRGNVNTTTGDTGAKTTSFAGATQTNYNARGAFVTILMGAVTGTTPTCTVQPQWSPDGGTTWLNYGPALAAITATGNHSLLVYPANLSQAAGSTPANLTTGAVQTVAINAPLPRTWRLNYTIGGTTPSFTITSVQVNYIL